MLRFDYFFPAFAQFSDLDASGVIIYIGYITADEYWMIEAFDQSNNSLRYAVGIGDYASNWTNRSLLVYDYLNKVLS